MGRIHSISGLLNVQSTDDFVANRTSSNQREMIIAIRLRAATNIAVNQEASVAWNERRIIRARMQEFASVH
jgi:hypothetical protein